MGAKVGGKAYATSVATLFQGVCNARLAAIMYGDQTQTLCHVDYRAFASHSSE